MKLLCDVLEGVELDWDEGAYAQYVYTYKRGPCIDNGRPMMSAMVESEFWLSETSS